MNKNEGAKLPAHSTQQGAALMYSEVTKGLEIKQKCQEEDEM